MSNGNFDTESRTDLSLPRPNTVESIITIVNRGDRFNLLNDPKAEQGNLDNDIHPVFHHDTFLGRTPHIKQALLLASLYLMTPSLLEFYVPLTFGTIEKEQTGEGKRRYNIYTRRKSVTRDHELRVVEAAFMCLAHCNTWRWADLWDDAENKRGWGVTHLVNDDTVHHSDECPVVQDIRDRPLFTSGKKSRITLDDQMLAFYLDEKTGYATRPRCEQFRHDFQVAMILGHELTHAYCAMMRGSLKEQWLDLSHPINELGYAWENFMFGGKIDPPQKTMPGSYAHLHKVWQSKSMVRKSLGFEYTAVPVSWTAQWFRKDTWEKVERYGHLTHPLPNPTLKISYSLGMQRYIVYTDNEDARRDLDRGRESAALGLSILTDGFAAKVCKDISRAFAMPLNDLARSSMAPIPRRYFETVCEDTHQYFLRNQRRDFEARKALTTARDQLRQPVARPATSFYTCDATRTGQMGLASQFRKLSVAGGSMKPEHGDSDSSSPSVSKESEGFCHSTLKSRIAPRFASNNDVLKKNATSSSLGHAAGKRPRKDDGAAEGPPRKTVKFV